MTHADLRFAGSRIAPPVPDALGLDPRLMNAERLLLLAGRHRLVLGGDPAGGVWLDCAECRKGVVKLAEGPGGKWPVSAFGMTCDMLRHQVMRHGLALSGTEST